MPPGVGWTALALGLCAAAWLSALVRAQPAAQLETALTGGRSPTIRQRSHLLWSRR